MRQLFGVEDSFNTSVAVDRRLLLRWVGWFWFCIATLSMLIGLKYPLAAGFPQTLDGRLFFSLLTLSHWHALYFLLTAVLFYPLILLLPVVSIVRSLLITLAVFLLVLIAVDTFAFSLFRFHLNGLVFSLLFSDAGGEIFVFGTEVYLFALLGLLGILAGVVWLSQFSWRLANRRNRRGGGYKLAALLLMLFMAQNFWFAFADASGKPDITSQARLYPLYMPTRADVEMRQWGLVDEVEKPQRLSANSGAVNYPKHALECQAEGTPPNLFVIVVDSWRYDEIDEMVTPNISRFAEESLIFERHYSGGNNTRTGLFSLLYGLPATYWESFLDARAGSELVNAIQHAKYRLAIYASAKLTGPEFDRTIFADVKNLRKRTDAPSVYGRDVLATEEFVASLKDGDGRPVFGFLFYDAPHAYAYAEKYQDYFKPSAQAMNYFALGKETDPTPYRNLHRNSVRSVDELVGQAMEAIKAAGLWDNSIIIVTADHAQEFNDNGLGFWGHNGNFTDAQIRVPLMIKWPGREPARFGHTTTHYDIAPTILSEMLGCSNPASDYSVGSSLFVPQSDRSFVVGGFGDFGVRQENLIHWVDQYGGVHVLSAQNERLEQSPDPTVIKMAIEQNSRYFR